MRSRVVTTLLTLAVCCTVITGQATKVGTHTTHPDAQWFPDAALGLFLH